MFCTDVFKDIRKFHFKFQISKNGKPGKLFGKNLELRKKLLEEELEEYLIALRQENLEDQIDALIDIMYVCVGTLEVMGVKPEKHWKEVHKANMRKKIATTEFLSKRGIIGDLYKPEGWIPPNHGKYI